MRCPKSVACIQDVVHVAVKLKNRLIKPYIVLLFGKYVTGVQQMLSKDQHGLREKDINYKTSKINKQY